MTKGRLLVAAAAAMVAAGVPAGAALASTPSTTGNGSIAQVCVTVTPKSVSVTINGTSTTQGTVGVNTTCIEI
jgi:hypothetical protein